MWVCGGGGVCVGAGAGTWACVFLWGAGQLQPPGPHLLGEQHLHAAVVEVEKLLQV